MELLLKTCNADCTLTEAVYDEKRNCDDQVAPFQTARSFDEIETMKIAVPYADTLRRWNAPDDVFLLYSGVGGRFAF